MTSEDRRLEKEVLLNATPEQVWEAITTGPGLASWFMPMEVAAGEGGESSMGTVTAWEPGKRFAVRTPEAEDGSFRAFEYLIEARGGGSTVLRFVQSGFSGDNWETEYEGMSHGWDMYFHTLGQYLTYFPGRTATYILAEGPSASADERAWSTVMAGLGLSGELSEGDTVRLTPDGLAPLEGVVDYLRPGYFLGVRTTDGLYRFHFRAVIGMSVAVGHHIYAGDVDGTETQKAWQSWLDRLFPKP